MFGAGKSSS
uniref:Uncharacterized protein n=1 Tax=Anguilla anguilla TaxID=7936 RepID=A0A0E9S6Q3_ANGAN